MFKYLYNVNRIDNHYKCGRYSALLSHVIVTHELFFFKYGI